MPNSESEIQQYLIRLSSKAKEFPDSFHKLIVKQFDYPAEGALFVNVYFGKSRYLPGDTIYGKLVVKNDKAAENSSVDIHVIN